MPQATWVIVPHCRMELMFGGGGGTTQKEPLSPTRDTMPRVSCGNLECTRGVQAISADCATVGGHVRVSLSHLSNSELSTSRNKLCVGRASGCIIWHRHLVE